MTRSLTKVDADATISTLRDDLEAALDRIDEYRRSENTNPEQQSYLNDYAVVRMAGFLEQMCFHAISGRVGEITEAYLQDFINSWFYKAPNLTAEQFRSLFKRFGPAIDAEVKSFLDEDLNRELLDSLLERRNAVAHGKEYSSSRGVNVAAFRTLITNAETLVRRLLLDSSARI